MGQSKSELGERTQAEALIGYGIAVVAVSIGVVLVGGIVLAETLQRLTRGIK